MRSQNKSKMNYLYAPETVFERQDVYSDLCKVIGNKNRLAMFKDIGGLSERLKNFDNPEIITLLGVKRADLPDILAIRELFFDVALIILLSDEDQETLSMAVRLRPKFVGIMSGDIDKIKPIVQRLVEKYRHI